MEYVIARNKAEEVKRKAKKDVWKNLGETMEQDLKGSKKKILGLAKSYGKDKSMGYNIKDEEGNVIVDSYKINEKWQSYFKELLNAGREDIVEDKETEEEVGEVDERQEQDNEITRDELEGTLKKMKNDEAPGCDALPTEPIKEGSTILKEKILRIFNKT